MLILTNFTFSKVPKYTFKNVTGLFYFSWTILNDVVDIEEPKYLNGS